MKSIVLVAGGPGVSGGVGVGGWLAGPAGVGTGGLEGATGVGSWDGVAVWLTGGGVEAMCGAGAAQPTPIVAASTATTRRVTASA